MFETFVVLVLAHVLGDFAFQPAAIATRKHRLDVLAKHVGIHVGLTIFVVGAPAVVPALVLGALHFAIDLIKARGFVDDEPRLYLFVTDQGAHLLSIWLVASAFPTLWAQSVWPAVLPQGLAMELMPAIAVGAGAMLAFSGGRFFVQTLLEELHLPQSTDDTLPKGGLWIGRIERLLVFTFVLLDQYVGISALIAAKSVLRFRAGDGVGSEARRESEYVIVGTLASVSTAIAAGLATRAVLDGLAS
ncbi:MAG: DUF3307 domain-containing protein [Pseudomonadota bacterium]